MSEQTRILLIEPQVPGALTAEDKITEMIVFSVSNEYFALRKALGLTIG